MALFVLMDLVPRHLATEVQTHSRLSEKLRVQVLCNGNRPPTGPETLYLCLIGRNIPRYFHHGPQEHYHSLPPCFTCSCVFLCLSSYGSVSPSAHALSIYFSPSLSTPAHPHITTTCLQSWITGGRHMFSQGKSEALGEADWVLFS